MKKERLKPGPKPKGHVRINLRGTPNEKKKTTKFLDDLRSGQLDVDKRDLLLGFKNWEVDNDIKNLTPEQLVDWYMEGELKDRINNIEVNE